MNKKWIIASLCVSLFAALACFSIGVYEIYLAITNKFSGFLLGAIVSFLMAGVNIPFVVMRIRQLRNMASQKEL